MVRVVRPGGTVAACMWDIPGGRMTMLRVFWTAVRIVEPTVPGEGGMAGAVEGDLVERFTRAGLADVTGGAFRAHAGYADFDDFWEPFTHAVGPAGQYVASLPADRQDRVRDACRSPLPSGPFTLDARAWCARGSVPTAAGTELITRQTGGT